MACKCERYPWPLNISTNRNSENQGQGKAPYTHGALFPLDLLKKIGECVPQARNRSEDISNFGVRTGRSLLSGDRARWRISTWKMKKEMSFYHERKVGTLRMESERNATVCLIRHSNFSQLPHTITTVRPDDKAGIVMQRLQMWYVHCAKKSFFVQRVYFCTIWLHSCDSAIDTNINTSAKYPIEGKRGGRLQGGLSVDHRRLQRLLFWPCTVIGRILTARWDRFFLRRLTSLQPKKDDRSSTTGTMTSTTTSASR